MCRGRQAGIPESVSLYPDWDGLEGASARHSTSAIIGWADKRRPCVARGGSHLVFGRDEARADQAELGAGHPFVQSPDPSSRPGALHADAGRRQAARHRPAVHAGVTAMMRDSAQLEQRNSRAIAARPTKPRSKPCASPRSARAARSRRCSKTLGTYDAGRAQGAGPADQRAEGPRHRRVAARREALKGAALDARLNTETVDVTLPVRESPAEIGRIHPSAR